MNRLKNEYIIIISALSDPIILLLSFLLSREIVFKTAIPPISYLTPSFLGLVIIWFIIGLSLDLYDNSNKLYTHNVVAKNTLGLAIFFLASSGFVFLSTDFKFSRAFLVYALIIHGLLTLCWRSFLFLIEKSIRKSGQYAGEVVVIGYDKTIYKLIQSIYNNVLYGYKLKAIFTDRKQDLPSLNEYIKGDLSEVEDYLLNTKVDQLLIALPHHQKALINRILKIADDHLIRTHIIPEFSDHLSQRFAIQYFGNDPVLKVRDEPLKRLKNRLIKRLMDIIISILSIVFIFSWLFPIIMIAVKLSSKGPIFFVQKRTGRDGHEFNCYKFRSMRVNDESNHKQASKNDPRVTKVGAFLRRTSLDETPQILNILQNHMSVVGPRPHMLKHTEEYKGLVDKFMVRHFAKPGLTGWAQINGFRGETKELVEMENRAEADIWYIENWSPFLDLKIIVSTISLLFFQKDENAY